MEKTDRMKNLVSIFRSAVEPLPQRSESVEAILHGIKNGRWKSRLKERGLFPHDLRLQRGEKELAGGDGGDVHSGGTISSTFIPVHLPRSG